MDITSGEKKLYQTQLNETFSIDDYCVIDECMYIVETNIHTKQSKLVIVNLKNSFTYKENFNYVITKVKPYEKDKIIMIDAYHGKIYSYDLLTGHCTELVNIKIPKSDDVSDLMLKGEQLYFCVDGKDFYVADLSTNKISKFLTTEHKDSEVIFCNDYIVVKEYKDFSKKLIIYDYEGKKIRGKTMKYALSK